MTHEDVTYKNQSIARIKVTSSTGSPTAVRTIVIVINPADGIPAAPIAAAVAVKLKQNDRCSGMKYSVVLCFRRVCMQLNRLL